uniref:Uncharacterized protein n=1 Tax=Anabas testudineus TaxID=64144 RepID=A0A3Q1J401_ANATE
MHGHTWETKLCVLIPVSETSDVFKNCILSTLQSAYLYEESQQSFTYKSALLIKNPDLEEKYNAFRAKRREIGYTEEELKETYGFLLFDDLTKAHTLRETGVLSGNSTCTTLGDPSKGVYISVYSDCLDLNRWYNGKSGYIAIIRLTKGRVKKVSENYTQNYTAPTGGFDCHVSEQLPSVSANTSSFLAFERTQYYMYELLDDGSNETSLSPSAACPFAIVSFSYSDTKWMTCIYFLICDNFISVCHYVPWRGRLQIGTQFYNVELRSTAKALITGKLPPVVKVEKAIPMLHLRQLLPRTLFETCFFEEGALPISLNDGGFLILLHSSHFLTYDDTGSNTTKVLQGLFVFPESRLIHRDTKFGERNASMSSEILRVLPVLSYAECEVEKEPIDPSEELCEMMVQHMQSYAALINPGLALSPSRDVSIFPDQYDVPYAHRHLYSSPEWTDKAWQSVRSYISKPLSFQLPVSKASQLLAAGQEERREDLDDDVYICLSSPEEIPSNSVSMESEGVLPVQKSPVNVETSVDSCVTSHEAHIDLSAVPQHVPHDWQIEYATKDNKKSDLTLLIKRNPVARNLLNLPPSDDVPAELIVSITSAKRTVSDESLGAINTASAMKHNDFELSDFSAAKLQTGGVNSVNDENVKIINGDCTDVTNITKTKRRKRRKHSRRQKKVSKAVTETPSLQTVNIPVEDTISKSQNDDLAKESSDLSQLSNSSNNNWGKLRRRKRKFGKLSSKTKKVRSAILAAVSEPRQQNLESSMSVEFEVCSMRKKTLRWDLKPLVSECGRILVPHGSVDFADQIKSLKDKLTKQSTNDEQYPEKILVVNAHDTSVNACDIVPMDQKSITAPETVEDKTEATKKPMDGVNYSQDIVFSDVNPEHCLLRQSDDNYESLPLNPKSSEHSSKNRGEETPSSEVVNEKHTDNLSPAKCATKSEFLLSKLKSVLLRGKRKAGVVVSGGITTDTAQDTEPFLKKGKVDSDTEELKFNNETAIVQNSVKEVSEMLSLDPIFAYALGLTPIEKPEKIQKTKGQDTQLRKDSKETQEQPILDKQPQNIQRSPSIYPRRDNSVRKTVKEKMNSACSSAEALNLLADLALNATNDQVPQQPDPALERKPETSFKKCDITKDVTSAEQVSVLHTLLRQPAARPIQPLESTSSSHPVEGTELIDLISKEHAYSLPPSSSLLLGLPGTPFQVSPISGSTRLLHHHQEFYGNGIQTLHPFVCQEDRGEHNHRTPEYLKKPVVHRQKFKYSRTFVNKDGTIQVTRQWKENYDFTLDSTFTSDSKDRTIIRALHGPWDFSIKDTSEELRLIVHMWIGLFYSRSTARFFHVDSNFTYPCSEENNLLETEMTSDPAHKKDISSLAQGVGILDLSLRNSNVDTDSSTSQVNRKKLPVSSKKKDASETVNTLMSLMGLHEASTFQVGYNVTITLKITYYLVYLMFLSCYSNGLSGSNKRIVKSTDSISQVNDARSRSENEKNPLQRAGCLEYTNAPSIKGYGSFIPPQEEIESVSTGPEKVQTASVIDHSLHVSTKEKTDGKDGTENSGGTEINLIQNHARNSSKSVTNKDMESNKELGEVDHTKKHEEIELKDGENSELLENPCKEDLEPPKVIHSDDDSTNKESSIACNGSFLENEEQISSEKTQAFSDKDVDCCTVTEGTVNKDEDHFGTEHGLDEKDGCISSVEAGSNLSDEPLPMICDSPDSIEKDCITDYPCHDLHLRKLVQNGSSLTVEHTISEETHQTPSEIELVCCEPVRENNLEGDVCFADNAGYEKEALPTSDESTCSVHGSCISASVPQTKDSVEPESQNLEMANNRFGLHSDQETKSIEGDEKDDAEIQKELFHDLHHSTQSEAITTYVAEEALTKEKDQNQSGIVIPFIGVDISGEDIEQTLISPPQGKVEELVQGQSIIPFISEPTNLGLPTGGCSTSNMYSGKTKLESDNRCPTPTIDEKPYQYISDPSISTCTNITQECLGRNSTSVKDEIPLEKKHCNESVNSKPNPHHDFHPDLDLRTQRVLQSIDKFLSKSMKTDKSYQLDTADMKQTFVVTPNPGIKHIPTCLTPSHAVFKGKQISIKKSEVVLASTSQELQAKSSDLISPFKSKLEEVLGVKLQLKRSDSSVPQHYFEKSEKDRYKTSQPGLSHEHISYSERPVMAVKPSKSDESQEDYICKDGQIENALKSKQTKAPVVTYTTPSSMEKTGTVKGNSDELNDDMLESSSSESSWSSSLSEWKLNCEKAKSAHFDPSRHYQENEFNHRAALSQSVQSLEPVKASSRFLDENQSYLTHSLVRKIGKTAKEKEDCSDASASFVDYKCNNTMEPETSLKCTVYNTRHQKCFPFLEHVSKRCLQDDLTQASMEQEHLIFYEQIKQLLKRSKRGPTYQQDAYDKLRSSYTSSLTVDFSSLEEQDDSLDYLLDAPSLIGQKIKVDMGDRKDSVDAREERKTLDPQGIGNQMEHAGVSDMAEECARLYEAMMNDVCAVKKVPRRSKFFRMGRVNQTTEPHNNFDFCDQMKREMDESFHSNLNSVVKKSSKTKYRFYILVTSGDAFFEKTKLEAQGHTAIESSEFFPPEDSSSLLIVLRNEDIAEHICEVPHLLELKKSPGVQFAGIDEPDDVVNLTHQELFTRGGFIMFNRAALESLSLCNMKKCSEILQELSRTGRWRWMLHYRDSRRLKEKARLSAEAKQKTHFLNWCQDTGILEVLPYHDCDQMSKDQPDYLTCLVHLQVQNISARYPVFITDTTTDCAFGRNGILTMTVDTIIVNVYLMTFFVF